MSQLALLGIKKGMTQIFNADEVAMPVTVIEAGPCVVTQIKTEKSDGYEAIQIGFGDRDPARTSKPMLGQFKKAKVGPKRHLAEIRVEDASSFKLGQTLGVDVFAEGAAVNVSGTTRGRGFQGVTKRHGFAGGPSGHGSRSHRIGGSIGASSFPSRVTVGKKMPGHMGNAAFTAKNLQVIKVIPESNLILIRGAVPGAKGSLVVVKHKG